MPDDSTIAIGAPSVNGICPACKGFVRIYKLVGTSWIPKGGQINGDNNGDQFGSEVVMPDNNTLVVSAPYNDDNSNNAGQIKVYKWNGNQWVQKGSTGSSQYIPLVKKV